MIKEARFLETEKQTLQWSDLFKIMTRDNGNRWYVDSGNIVAKQYIDEGCYRQPSRAWPHSHSKPLLTKKFAKWLKTNHPKVAVDLGLLVEVENQNDS
jgi:hypothetical protein